ncbi:hypothetical protein [uncultured Tessaracoccus sp.]|uniref:hypothetical protein n=1 Tax=uncultured Tessaracoccus sp. TaxID=905023 RepID=UPI0025DC7A8C|nr:hypothetical protein [uncultured Tessaracoccus sp.]
MEPDEAVREAVVRDLARLGDGVRVEPGAMPAVGDARALDRQGVALVVADVSGLGEGGVGQLEALTGAGVDVVLLTPPDGVPAPNAPRVRRLAKPWSALELEAVARELLTDVVERRGLDPAPHLPALDAERALTLVALRSGD